VVRTGRSTRVAAGLAVAGVALTVAGLQHWHSSSRPADEPAGTSPTALGSSVGGAATALTPQPVLAAARPGMPRRVVIPTLHVAAPVVPVEAVGDTLVPPADPGRLGWWADGARPGDRRGTALVAGHTVHTGGGALEHLGQLTRHARIVVFTHRARIVYDVQRVTTYSKGRIAEEADRLFSQDARGRLVLVTCADWDGSRYLSNVVVVARPLSG
jgi:hypothetical protein